MDVFKTPWAHEHQALRDSLARIVSDAPWLGPALGMPELQSAFPPQAEQAHQPTWTKVHLRGDYGLAGAIISPQPSLSSLGLRRVRAVFILCVLLRKSSRFVPHLAASLRAANDRGNSAAGIALDPIIRALETAETLPDVRAALSRLEWSAHKGLKACWNHLINPLLSDVIARMTSPAAPIALGKQPSRSARPPPQRSKTFQSSAYVGDVLAPGEPATELATQEHLLPPPPASGLMRLARGTFHAARAIWGSNHLLLANHVSSLDRSGRQAVLRSLTARLAQLDAADPLAVGMTCALFGGLTGLSIPGRKALCAGDQSFGWHLDLPRGQIHTRTFWKQGDTNYFTPTKEAQALLDPSPVALISLPLPSPLRTILRQHATTITLIATSAERDLERQVREAMRTISDEVDIPITDSELRNSLATSLYEACGDPATCQLICANGLGLSIAPLAYYSPTRGALAAAFAKSLQDVWPNEVAETVSQGSARVGSELLVNWNTATRLAKTSRGRLPDGTDHLLQVQTRVLRHRSMVDHLARMLMTTAGHRPSKSLFELTRWDVDLSAGYVLARDKRVDGAHDPRIAAMPLVLIRQWQAWLDHLANLSLAAPCASARALQAIDGSAPLLFDLDDESYPRELSLPIIADRGPPLWRQLPLNWGRTQIRTRGIELGLSPACAMMQLGHLEPIGWPFSNHSPTAPAEFIRETRPHLDDLALQQRWTVIPAGVRSPSINQLPELRDWSALLAESEHRHRSAQELWVRQWHAERKPHQAKALQAILEHRDLAETAITDVLVDRRVPDSLTEFERIDWLAVRESLSVTAPDAISAHFRQRALSRIVRHLGRLGAQIEDLPPAGRPYRRPLDNALIPGLALATEQIHALRLAIRMRGHGKRPRRDLAVQAARLAEALVVFGHIDDADAVLELLDTRTTVHTSAKLVDLSLCTLRDGRVVALRGLASLALARFHRRQGDAPRPERDDIDQALGSLLPEWATGGTTKQLLVRLCSTQKACNRYELSPAARLALNPELGAISASATEQIAFVDGDPAGSQKRTPQRDDATSTVRLAITGSVAVDALVARKQYLSLCQRIPRRGHQLTLSTTGRVIPAASVEKRTTRDAVVAEIDAWLHQSDERDPGSVSPIVRLLAMWILKELSRQTASGDLLADRTIHTYLTRIGRALTAELGGLKVHEMDEEAVETAYEFALESAGLSKKQAALALLRFHDVASAVLPWHDVDLGTLRQHLGPAERRVDANLILPSERDAASDALRQQAWANESMPFEDVRLSRMLDAVFPLYGWGGARLSEPLGMQLGDLSGRRDGRLWCVVRSNASRRLKTRAARRVLDLSRLPTALGASTLAWRHVVKAQVSNRLARQAFVFSDLNDPHGAAARDSMASNLRTTLGTITGRGSDHPHRLRHLVATEMLMEVFLSGADQQAIRRQTEPATRPVLLPRDLQQIACALGHATWQTTISTYLHLPWVTTSRVDAALIHEFGDRHTCAGVLGVTPFTMDFHRRGQATDTGMTVWFDQLRPRRLVTPSTTPSSTRLIDRQQWTAVDFGRLLLSLNRLRDLRGGLLMVGAPLADQAELEPLLDHCARRIGRSLFPRRDRAQAALRRRQQSVKVEQVWGAYDRASDTDRWRWDALAEGFMQWCNPDQLDVLHIHPRHRQAMQTFIELAQLDPATVVCESRAGGLDRWRFPHENSETYHGLAIKRALAILWIVAQLRNGQNATYFNG